MQDAGILPGFAGIVVSDRYQNYFHPRWEHIAGNQACLSHLLRDFEDCAETYPGAVWPGTAGWRGGMRTLLGGKAERFGMGPAVVLGQCLAERTGPVGHGAPADLAAGDRQPGDGDRETA